MRRLLVWSTVFCVLLLGGYIGYEKGKSWLLSRFSEEASRAVLGKVTAEDASLGWFSLRLHNLSINSFLGVGSVEEISVSFEEYSSKISRISVVSPRLSVTLPVSNALPVISSSKHRDTYLSKYREHRLAVSSPRVSVRSGELLLTRREGEGSLRLDLSSWSWEGFSPVTVGGLWSRGVGEFRWEGGFLQKSEKGIFLSLDDLAAAGRLFVARKPAITGGRGSLHCEVSSCRFVINQLLRGDSAPRDLSWEVKRSSSAERDVLLFVIWVWGSLWERILEEESVAKSKRKMRDR